MTKPRLYTDEERHERHLEAAKRYRQKNLQKVREANRLFMQSYDNTLNYKRYWEKNKSKLREKSRARRFKTISTPDTVIYGDILLADVCSYCGNRDGIEIDHIVPLYSGGDHAVDNLTAACKSCNSSKGAKSLLEFLI